MKRLLILMVITFASNGPVMAKTWGTATSKNEVTGRVIIYRYISEFDQGFNRASQPVRVIIVWKYKGTNGMPLPRDRERMDAMEDLLGPIVETDGFATLALVSTGEELREWTYYAKSEDGFLARLNQALDGPEPFPIEIHIADDPKWSNYQEFVGGLRE